MSWLVCLFLGHAWTDWHPVLWVTDTLSGTSSWPTFTTTAIPESRFCVRCHGGYEQRWAS